MNELPLVSKVIPRVNAIRTTVNPTAIIRYVDGRVGIKVATPKKSPVKRMVKVGVAAAGVGAGGVVVAKKRKKAKAK